MAATAEVLAPSAEVVSTKPNLVAIRLAGGLWPFVVLLLATVPAVRQLFWPGYISAYDGAYHLTRMIEVNSLVRQGVLYPRWFPDFGLGHGYPIFNFFPPLSYLVTEIPALLLSDLPLAIQMSMAASMVVAGWGTYVLARSLDTSKLAAVAAAGCYLYFPYHIQDIYTRGDLPELWFMAWLPFLLWAHIKAARTRAWVWVAATAFWVAIEIGTHNVLSIFALPAALAITVLLAPRNRSSMLAAAGCDALGFVLAAGYWLPGFVEFPLTHVKQLAGDWLVYHLVDLGHLLEPGFFAPHGSDSFVHRLSILEAVAAVGLCLLLLWRSRARDTGAIGLIGLLVVLIALLTNWALPFWQHVPLMGFIQFPWRLLIVIDLVLTVMMVLVSRWHGWVWAPVALLAMALAVGSLGKVPAQRFLPPLNLDAATLQTQEYGSSVDGVAIESEYQPATSTPDLVKAAQGKTLPTDSTAAPPISVREVALGATDLNAVVDAPVSSVLRLQWLFFPGWQAYVDGRGWQLEPTSPAGLIELQVPAGSHNVAIRYEGTPVEGIAGCISGLSLLATGLWLGRRHKAAGAALLVLGGAVAVLLIVRPSEHQQFTPREWSPSANERLVGSGAPQATSRGIEERLLWLVRSPAETSFDFVMKDAAGQEISRTPASRAQVMPTEYTAVNEVLDRRYILPRPKSSGDYRLFVQSGAASTELGGFQVDVPETPARALDVAFQDGVTLRSYAVDRVANYPKLKVDDVPSRADVSLYRGEFVRVALRWETEQRLPQNYVTFVHLVDKDGGSWASHDNQPNATLQATSSWVPGQIVPDDFLLKLPSDIPTGVYRLEVGLYHIDEQGYHFLRLTSGGNSVLFGAVKVIAARPSAPQSSGNAWVEPITLAAWHEAAAGSSVAVTLDWLATGGVSRDYTVFAHLLDSAGQVVATADSPPQANAFPTSLWEAGDRISDVHTFGDVPDGQYRLSIGWYRSDTGERLKMADGNDELYLGTITRG